MAVWSVTMVNPSRAKGLFSPCGLYRYRLERNIGEIDPSENDHTIVKLFGFGARHGADRFIVTNKFALISTDINGLKGAADPIGPDNDAHIEQAMRDADFHIVAWGRLSKLPPKLRSRWLRVCTIADRVGCKLHCLTAGQDGHPKHPLTLGYDTPIVEWKRP
jgi:hypothetical protein